MSNQLIIADIAVRQDSEGRYNLNDLHQAAGGDPKDRPGEWLKTGRTQALAAEVANANIIAIKSKRGRYGGTFVVKEVSRSSDVRIAPAFSLKVCPVK